jgi:negative regulator of replication initiation
MANDDVDEKLVNAIRATKEEIDGARNVVHALANELADVIEVIEPALVEHTRRLRQARMMSLEEMRQVTTAVREMRDLLLSKQTDEMLIRAERFLAVCRELEEFRMCGFLDAFVRLFVEASHERSPA